MRRALVLALLLLASCRGQSSSRPPRHLFDDMDWQQKYRPEAKSAYFSDGRTMRTPLEGTVAVGELREDGARERGRDVAGNFVTEVPGGVDRGRLRLGEERFGIYCSPCHDRSGSGHGAVVVRGFPQPVDLASTRVLGLPDGQIFATISEGVRNMPSYAMQVPVEDRWAIVLWVRVLQRARHATLADAPEAERTRLQAEAQP